MSRSTRLPDTLINIIRLGGGSFQRGGTKKNNLSMFSYQTLMGVLVSGESNAGRFLGKREKNRKKKKQPKT